AFLRKLLFFSHELREAWSVRRRTAKLYDSFQWRKLMWIGVGLSLYLAVSNRYTAIQIGVSMFCLITGACGMLRWRAVVADNRYPKPTARRIKAIIPHPHTARTQIDRGA